MSLMQVKLEDVFLQIRNGASIKQTDGFTGIPITRIETIADSTIDMNRLGFADINNDAFKDYYLENGDILMSHINSWTHLGKNAIVNDINEKIIHGMNLLLLKANDKILCPKFAKYYFDTDLFKQQLYKISNQSVNQSSFSLSKLKNLFIPFPPLPIQKRIAEILDAADALKRKDQVLLKKYDELAQAIFVDMFGDPVKNEKGWDEIMLKDLSLRITDGTHLSPKFTTSGIPFLFVSNIVNNQIVYETSTFISEEEFELLNKRTPIEIGNILLTTVGSYGNPAIIERNDKFAFQRHIAFIKPNHELINYIYLFGFLQSPVAKHQIDKKVNGVAQKTLNLSDLKELKIWNVPRTLQDEYSKRLMLLKDQNKNMLDNCIYSDELFDSLIQKAFKGELVN